MVIEHLLHTRHCAGHSRLNSGLTVWLVWTLPAAVTIVQGNLASKGPWSMRFKCVDSEGRDEEEEDTLLTQAAVLPGFYSQVPKPPLPSP